MKTSNALKRNVALNPFSVFIGEWAVEGTHPYVPNTILHGHYTFAWCEGGAFVVMRSSIDDSRFPDGIAIFGSDDVTGKFFQLYFDERGISRKYDVFVEDTILKWQRDTPEFSQHFTLTISPEGQTMVGEGTMRQEGKEWEKDIQVTCKRTT